MINRILQILSIIVFGIVIYYFGYSKGYVQAKNEITITNNSNIDEIEIRLELLERQLKIYESNQKKKDIIKKKVDKIIKLESGGKHSGVWGKAGEYGIAQFKQSCFVWMSKKAGFKNMEWKNKEHQIKLLTWAVENNLHRKYWTTARKYNI